MTEPPQDLPAGGSLTRPRVEGDREQEILDGALEVLVDLGYDRLTFDAVAAHVRASKATLYRRWSTKADLVVSAVEASVAMTTAHEIPDTGSLRGDLVAMFVREDDLPIRIAEIIAAVMPAMHRDPDLTEAVKERIVGPKTAALRTMIERAQRAGEVGPDANVDLLVAIIPALNMHLVVTTGQCPALPVMRTIIDSVVLPACRATRRLSYVGDRP